MHMATTLMPCLHSMCKGCASKCLSAADKCPACRDPVSAVGPAYTVNAAVDALHAAGPGRKRPADELSALDKDAESLEGHVKRITRQRRAVSTPLLDAVRAGDVAALQDLVDDGDDIDEHVEGVGSLLHAAVDAEDLEMVSLQTLTPKPYTLNPKPQTSTHSQPQTLNLNLKPQALNAKPQAPHP